MTSAFCETRTKLPGKPPGLNPTPPGRVRQVKGKPPRQTSRASQASLGQVSVPTFTCFYLLIDGSCLMDLMDGRRRLSVFRAAKASFLCIAQALRFSAPESRLIAIPAAQTEQPLRLPSCASRPITVPRTKRVLVRSGCLSDTSGFQRLFQQRRGGRCQRSVCKSLRKTECSRVKKNCSTDSELELLG